MTSAATPVSSTVSRRRSWPSRGRTWRLGWTFFALSPSPELVALFEERLPATALSLAQDREGLTAAVGLYHMVLEGVVLLAGQNAMLDTLGRVSIGLPGVRRGVELVLRDERWHMGFGTRLVQSAKLSRDELEALLALGQAAAGAWGDLVSPGAAERAVRMHQRRLRAVVMKFW